MSTNISDYELSYNWRVCTQCGYRSEMLLISQDDDDYDNEHEGHAIKNVFKILKCRSCEAIIVLRFVACIPIDDEIYLKDSLQQTIYRENILYSLPRVRDEAIPNEIAEVAIQAESIARISPRAAVVLCRAALEEICRERGITHQGSLQQKLDNLFQHEHLAQEMKEIMHAIRLLGNEGAHSAHAAFVRDVQLDDVHNLIGLLDYVLERIYVDKARAQVAAERLSELRNRIFKKT